MRLCVMFAARSVLHCNKQRGDEAKEEFEGAGPGRSRDGRLGYKRESFFPPQIVSDSASPCGLRILCQKTVRSRLFPNLDT